MPSRTTSCGPSRPPSNSARDDPVVLSVVSVEEQRPVGRRSPGTRRRRAGRPRPGARPRRPRRPAVTVAVRADAEHAPGVRSVTTASPSGRKPRPTAPRGRSTSVPTTSGGPPGGRTASRGPGSPSVGVSVGVGWLGRSVGWVTRGIGSASVPNSPATAPSDERPAHRRPVASPVGPGHVASVPGVAECVVAAGGRACSPGAEPGAGGADAGGDDAADGQPLQRRTGAPAAPRSPASAAAAGSRLIRMPKTAGRSAAQRDQLAAVGDHRAEQADERTDQQHAAVASSDVPALSTSGQA